MKYIDFHEVNRSPEIWKIGQRSPTYARTNNLARTALKTAYTRLGVQLNVHVFTSLCVCVCACVPLCVCFFFCLLAWTASGLTGKLACLLAFIPARRVERPLVSTLTSNRWDRTILESRHFLLMVSWPKKLFFFFSLFGTDDYFPPHSSLHRSFITASSCSIVNFCLFAQLVLAETLSHSNNSRSKSTSSSSGSSLLHNLKLNSTNAMITT